MSFRARLSILFVTTMTALVVATSIATYLIVRSNLHANARADALALAKNAASIEDVHEVSLDRIAGPGASIWLTNGSGAVIGQSYTDRWGRLLSHRRRQDARRRSQRLDRGAVAPARWGLRHRVARQQRHRLESLHALLDPHRGGPGRDRGVRGAGSGTRPRGRCDRWSECAGKPTRFRATNSTAG